MLNGERLDVQKTGCLYCDCVVLGKTYIERIGKVYSGSICLKSLQMLHINYFKIIQVSGNFHHDQQCFRRWIDPLATCCIQETPAKPQVWRGGGQ